MWQQLRDLAALVEQLVYRVAQLEARVARLEQGLGQKWGG
jgi:hypothetical protein